MTKAEQAKQYFLEGYNCAQAVFLAFANDTKLDKDIAVKIASSFGGGIGAQREVCGTVSGMVMALGLLRGYKDPKDYNAKKQHYAIVQELCKKFKEENGSIICRELLGISPKNAENTTTPQQRTQEYYAKRPCADLCACAVNILETYLKNN